MSFNKEWESVYLDFVNNTKTPAYDHKLWSWLINNYYPPVKIKQNEEQEIKEKQFGKSDMEQ